MSRHMCDTIQEESKRSSDQILPYKSHSKRVIDQNPHPSSQNAERNPEQSTELNSFPGNDTTYWNGYEQCSHIVATCKPVECRSAETVDLSMI